jgi:hypothetical protein
MTDNEIKELSQRFYSLYCNCPIRDERKIYLDISSKLNDLLDIHRYKYK